MPEATDKGITKIVLCDANGVPYDLTGGGGGGVPVGTIVDYVEFNTDITVTGTTEALATVIVTGAGFTANGTDTYWVEFMAPGVKPGAGVAAQVFICVYDNGSSINAGQASIAQVLQQTAAVMVEPVMVRTRLTPSAASHTYSIRAYRQVADGQVRGTGAAATRPGYICVTKAS